MEISVRLQAIAGFVPENSVVADVGTDHAYLPVYLIKKGISPLAIAGDIGAGPLKSAWNTVSAYGLEDKIELRQGNGLQILSPGEVDAVIIAGMGGKSIINIMERAPKVIGKLDCLVLQPNNHPAELRQWLVENNRGIVKEKLVREKSKYYPVILSKRGEGNFACDNFSLEIGPYLLKHMNDPLLVEFLEKKEREYSKILSGLSRSKKPGKTAKEKIIKEMYERTREVLAIARKSFGNNITGGTPGTEEFCRELG